ncbi:MAG: glycosyltransferase [Acidimicrobiia bacterium]
MTPTIYEPSPLGHRLDFVRLIATGLIDLGLTPTWVTTEAAAQSAEAATHLGGILGDLDIRADATPLDDLSATNARARFNDLRQLASDQEVDWLYVPYGDHVAQLAAIPGLWPKTDTPTEALLFRARFAYPRDRHRDRALAAASLRAATATPWTHLFFLDPLAAEYLGRDGIGHHDLMPEPVEQHSPIDRNAARAMFDLPEDARVLALTGAIDERKGALELARAFADADLPDGVVLAYLGTVGTAIKPTLGAMASADDRIVIVDRHLNDDEFWAAMCSADVLCATYLRHVGSSGIVARAAYLGTPMLSSDYGWVGEATRRYGLGTTVDTIDHENLTAAVERVARSDLASTRTATSEPFVAFNTPERFTDLWMQGIGEGR